ncbi:3-hydroxyacyl-CoA dehydrogenase/enoyl-CoA hydratase family protein [Dongshaea marina]|uniref:3-hydroxyacyl-CoA dehydrogenase/enoyl-CoA hydratase family protein n=1 Tax=Dongshaea marina TaxID=2047966 RepID=UPI000D3E08A6|nr:3-hydroxyacyl-CoA dehydrogenase/enoyl-CoA hydratase family protein [Dongshaea marina]
MRSIDKVAVIGAGVMGAGIAAQISNAGVPVLLFDRVSDGDDPDAIARGALTRLAKSNPAALMHPSNAKLITPLNTRDDLGQLAECDWIIEAILEEVSVKQSLYRKIQEVRTPGSLVSSNTSTLCRAQLVDGMPEEFTREFMITHFFNPPRYMRLLELVAGEETSAELVSLVSHFCDEKLGKGVLNCRDTPGFLANRIGIFWLQCAVVQAMQQGISIELADAVISRPFGIPKTGVFGLLDMVGLDLMPHVLSSLEKSLAATDPFHAIYREPELLNKMIAEGYIGRKGKGGFYRLNTESGIKVKEAIDLQTGNYARAMRPKPPVKGKPARNKLRKLLSDKGDAGAYAWSVMASTLSYAASLVPDVSEDIEAIDLAMKLGYNWKYGPFELIDQLGAGWLCQELQARVEAVPPILKAVGEGHFYRNSGGVREIFTLHHGYRRLEPLPGVLLLEDIKAAGAPVLKNPSASLWDIGDGVLCLEFHSKMNSLNLWSLSMMERAIKKIEHSDFRALVIYNDGSNFSVGANIGLLAIAARLRAYPFIDYVIRRGQRVYQALKFAPFPVVSAPSGMALGGGCELLLHSDAIVAHAETYTGLVEVGVGIIPGWGGCKEMLGRWAQAPDAARGPMPAVTKVFELIGMAKVAKSAAEAKEMKILRPTDSIIMNRQRLLADAKTRALELARDYQAPEPVTISLPGQSGKIPLDLMVAGLHRSAKATSQDQVICEALSGVLSGGDADMTEPVTEERLLELEREAFHRLSRDPESIKRVNHMLKTGKPLRN